MDKTQLVELTQRGLTVREIAAETEKSYTNVRYWLGQYELKTLCKPHNKGGNPKSGLDKLSCKDCGETDPARFYVGGRKRIKVRCRNCHNKDQISRFRAYKAKAVEYKGGKCEVCGYGKCLAAMDFHHVDPKMKDPNWAGMKNRPLDKIKDELDKCMLVCRNCHAEIHYSTSQIRV